MIEVSVTSRKYAVATDAIRCDLREIQPSPHVAQHMMFAEESSRDTSIIGRQSVKANPVPAVAC